jgi:hypothetical protein
MALTIHISSVDDAIAAFAKNDIILSHMTKRFAEQGEYTEGMGPGDDYYTAPFALASGWTRKTASRPKEQAIKLCFTAYKCREAHDLAIRAMGDLGSGIRALGSMVDVERWIEALCKPKQIVKFRRYAWTGGDDVSLDLEDRAMKMTCDFLGVTVPPDWRARREAIVKEHAVWALYKLPQTAVIGPDDKETEKQLPLTKCGCGNYAKPNSNFCNACTALLAKDTCGEL